MNRARVYRACAVVAALAVVVAGKQLYRDASAADLNWILAPTAKVVSWLTGGHFAYEPAGWADHEIGFVIAVPCAGVNFALAAFLALVIGALPGMTTVRATALRLAACAAIAYVATLAINTIRIAIAVAMHRADLGGAERHQIEGIFVYLVGLCMLYALARRVSRPPVRREAADRREGQANERKTEGLATGSPVARRLHARTP